MAPISCHAWHGIFVPDPRFLVSSRGYPRRGSPLSRSLRLVADHAKRAKHRLLTNTRGNGTHGRCGHPPGRWLPTSFVGLRVPATKTLG
jgi:hypothetical protein